jgi:DNA primase
MYDEDVIREIKESISLSDYASQFVDLKYVKGQYEGLCPLHKEKTPSFKIDSDDKFFHCFGCHKSGDIFDFIQAYKKVSLNKAIKIASDYSGIKINKPAISDTIKIYRTYNRHYDLDDFCHTIIPEEEYDKFELKPVDSWVEEGIYPTTMQKFNIRIDEKHSRAIYPVRDINGNLINIKGRTLIDCYKELKIPKYINYYKVGRLDYFQGLNDALPYAKDKNELIVFEGVKSCMKAYQFGQLNVASAETSILNNYQARLLISLGCDITIAFDKDKELRDYANRELKLLSRFCNVYYIDDEKNLLGGKENKMSPVDLGADVWNELYETRKRVIL